MKFSLVEIFESLQGEGRNVGKQCVFVRFAGCNLKCPWCDTDFSRRFEATTEEITREIERYAVKKVILTGGEPTMQEGMEELIAALKEKDFWIAVETNGTNAREWLQFVDYVACSPKRDTKIELARANEVRIVAVDDECVEFCKKIKDLIIADDYYVSPCERDGKIDFATAKNVLSRLPEWSLSVQLHKILGFR